MTSHLYLPAAAAAMVVGILLFRKRMVSSSHWLFPFLGFVLPFAAGGFHTYVTAVCTAVILAALALQVRKQGSLRIFRNLPGLAVLALTAGYCLSPLWAADRGMAVFAIPRYLPAALYLLYRMQCEPEDSDRYFSWIPLCGGVMTVASLALLLIPQLRGSLPVNGRLAGFFQYPNTFAAFLLAGLIIHTTGRKSSAFLPALLILGIVLSGSKTVLVLLGVALAVLIFLTRDCRKSLQLILSGCGALVLGLLFARSGLLEQADRFTDIQATSGTFLVRLLYYKDALPVILKHPFGTGYLGYAALEGSFQTGRYYVRYVHNGLLQILLDIGWVPGLLLAGAFLKTLFSPGTPRMQRLLLLFCLAHCLLDFDLQFLSIWAILLTCLDVHRGKHIALAPGKGALCLSGVLVLLCLWLGAGELLQGMGRTEACLSLTPFHTEALTARLSVCEDPEEADRIADKILALSPTHSVAASAKANSAFSRGDIPAMAAFKEQAIQNARYTTAEYCDYFDKLHYAYRLYLQSGDPYSADYCRQKLLQIPQMMAAVSQSTDPLAPLTGDDSTLQLPREYHQILETLR